MADNKEDNVGIALLLTFAAGASTGLGAAVVFFPSLVKLASRRVLAASLGFSAGVMTYVSFVEIFFKAEEGFIDAGIDEGLAHAWSTLCFFGGVVVMMILNIIVSALLGGHSHKHNDLAFEETEAHHKDTTREDIPPEDVDTGYGPPCCNTDPANQLKTVQKMASVLQHEHEAENAAAVEEVKEPDNPAVQVNAEEDRADPESSEETPADNLHEEAKPDDDSHEKKRLVKTGMNTALAIALHNFPEGLATFVATLNDPKVGVVLAVAIAIHNIPEGLCVSLPIFYANGNRFKAFMWGMLSGATEFVAGLLGWAILANSFTDITYAVLFGIVSGMMVIISIRELLPTAHFYDPEDTLVTNSFIAGMVVMALSIVMFEI